jgi:glycosyltransferase involved in cell wall biosynthesis
VTPGPTGAPPLSVVLPMHNTRAHVTELLDRLVASCPPGTELVCVDDGCPQRSADAVRAWAEEASTPVRLLRLTPGVGQHAALMIGLAHTTGDRAAVMDADLQDAPEDVATLLDTLAAEEPAGVDLVAAGRRGDYEAGGRQRTARWYRRAVTLLSRGRVPADAGMFSAMTGDARDRILDIDDPVAPLVPLAARAGVRMRTVPVERRARPDGPSSTSSTRRARIAWRGIVTLLPIYPLVRRRRFRRWPRPTVAVEILPTAARAHASIPGRLAKEVAGR